MGKGYQELEVWKKGYRLANLIYIHTKNFPSKETYGLVSQMRRSSVSIAANIAEGYGRGHIGEYIQFLSIAIGSSNELEVYILLSHDLGYLSDKDFNDLQQTHAEVSKMLHSLRLSLEEKRQSKP
jgi:four helix bundle protein